MTIVKKVILLAFFLYFIVIYRNWFTSPVILSTDYPFFWNEWTGRSILQFSFSSWAPTLWLGTNAIFLLNSAPYDFIMGIFMSIINNWEVTHRIFWLFLFLILGIFSSYYLSLKLLGNQLLSLLASIIFMSNTYVLMLASGGQIPGVGLAYAVSPLVLLSFVTLTKDLSTNNRNQNIAYAIIFAIFLSLQTMWDIRISLTSVLAILLFIPFSPICRLVPFIIYACITPLILGMLLHSYWLIPQLLIRSNPLELLGSGYTTTAAVTYLSFATLENTMSLLHPNWPENIFGKTYFMRWEFLILPILAYLSLLYAKNANKQLLKNHVVYFAILGLLGAFLAKGANAPFGEIYLWMFEYVPGFSLFRDPTKFYVLVAISYSFLIPFSIGNIYKWLGSKPKLPRYFPTVFVIFSIACVISLTRPALLGQLKGTFERKQIPEEFVKLKNFLYNQNTFFRTLWIPQKNLYGFFSDTHPAISAQSFYSSSNVVDILQKLKDPSVKDILEKASVKYVIVPSDPNGNQKLYDLTVSELLKMPWLKQNVKFGNIRVFEISNYSDHFWIKGVRKISHKKVSATEFYVNVKNVKKDQRLVFSEGFDFGWKAIINNKIHNSQKYNGLYNSFLLPTTGSYAIKIYYPNQKLVGIGIIISTLTLLPCIFYLLWYSRLNKKRND